MIERSQADLETARQLLRDLDVALTDWVRQYAPDMCSEKSCKESIKRVWDAGGTLAYIAALRERIRRVTK